MMVLLRNIAIWLKNIFLFFLAPFIALVYIFALPIVGMYYMAKTGYEAYKSE